MIASILERELEGRQQSLGFRIGLRSGRDADIHTTESIDLVVLDFRENNLLFHTHVVVTLTIKALAGDTAEVANTRQGDCHQAIQEFEHTRPAKGNHTANRVAITNLESGDRLASLGGNRFLTCNLLHVTNRIFEHLLVSNRLANTH